MDIHELTAAYAIDALDAAEAEAYEEHLSQCEQCRTELAELKEAATALAFGAAAPAPPARLRGAILEAAAAERSNVIPLARRRWVTRGFAVAAAAAAFVAVGFAVSGLQSGPGVVSAVVVLDSNRAATLEVTGLRAAPRGETYETWVIPAAGAPRPAGLFAGGENGSFMRLRGVVPRHSVVAVTLEPAGGVSSPTTVPILSTRT